MRKLLSVKDIQDRYSCSAVTARRYMRRMEHLENPLRVSEQSVEKWELERTYSQYEKPGDRKRGRRHLAETSLQSGRIPRQRPA